MVGMDRSRVAQPTPIGVEPRVHKTSVRVLGFAEGVLERFAILQLQTPFDGARPLQMREAPLGIEEKVISIAYLDGKLRFAKGIFWGFCRRHRCHQMESS